MSVFQQLLAQYGWPGLIRFSFYPLTTLLTTPVRLIQTLWACRVLVNGKWGDYLCFTPHMGLNHLFYWTAALNLYQFGRAGRSPYIGLGNYYLSRFFYYTLPSLYSFWGASTVTVLCGMFNWWLLHLIWISDRPLVWVLLVMSLTLVSTTFYANTFALQNYNAVGWMFFSLGLYGLATERWLLASLAWFAASFGSFTVIFLVGILSLPVAIYSWTLAPVLVVLPAGLRLLTHFWFSLSESDLKTTLFNIMKLIGTTRRNVKYKRTLPQEIRVAHVYYFLLYAQFSMIVYWKTGNVSLIFLTGLIIYLINISFARFADIQTLWILMLSLATVVMMENFEPWLLPSFWILASPPPLIAVFPSVKHIPDVVPKLAPFAIKPLLDGIGKFISPVRKGQRILMAFDDPNGAYGKIFDGYRVLLELPHYVAAKKEVHFMPDWWGVAELNYEGAPDFWGRDVASVLKNADYWQADFVIIYQEGGTELASEWRGAGFKVMAKFSWLDYREELGGNEPYHGPTPDWWLLRKPENN